MQQDWGGGTSHEHAGRRKRQKWNPRRENTGLNGNSSAPPKAPSGPRATRQRRRSPPRLPSNTQRNPAQARTKPFRSTGVQPTQPTPLSEDHPLMIEMAQLKVVREQRRLYWSGIQEAIGEEWDNSAAYDRQTWEKEESLADKKFAELAGKIALAERGIFIDGYTLSSDIARSGTNQQKEISRAYSTRSKKDATVTWHEEKTSKAVDKWMEEMGMPQTIESNQEPLFFSDSGDNNAIVYDPIDTRRDINTARTIKGNRSSMKTPSERVGIAWAAEDEAIFEEAEFERERQRIEASLHTISISRMHSQEISSTFEEAEKEREQQRNHVTREMTSNRIASQDVRSADSRFVRTDVDTIHAQTTSSATAVDSRKVFNESKNHRLPRPDIKIEEQTEAPIKEEPRDDSDDAENRRMILKAILESSSDFSSLETEEPVQPIQLPIRSVKPPLQPVNPRAPQFDHKALAIAAFCGLQERGLIDDETADKMDVDVKNDSPIEMVDLQDVLDSASEDAEDADDEESVVNDGEAGGIDNKLPDQTPEKTAFSSVVSPSLSLPFRQRLSTPFPPPPKLVAQMSKRERQDRVIELEKRLQKIQKYKLQRTETGGALSFEKLRAVNREEDVLFELEELRAWQEYRR